MPATWYDSVEKAHADGGIGATSHASPSTYVPPHLRNRPSSASVSDSD